jgi:hypothetical protein
MPIKQENSSTVKIIFLFSTHLTIRMHACNMCNKRNATQCRSHAAVMNRVHENTEMGQPKNTGVGCSAGGVVQSLPPPSSASHQSILRRRSDVAPRRVLCSSGFVGPRLLMIATHCVKRKCSFCGGFTVINSCSERGLNSSLLLGKEQASNFTVTTR